MDILPITGSDLSSKMVSRLDEASFFTSVSFANLWKTVGGRAVYFVAGENDRLIAALPGVEFGRRRVTRFQAMPNGCYCQPVSLADDRDEFFAACAGFLGAIKHSRYMAGIVTDYYGLFGNSGEQPSAQSVVDVIDISDPDWQPPDKKLISEIRKAEREGLQDEPFDRERHIEGFLKLVEVSTDRQNRKSRYPNEFFVELARIATDDPRVLWLYAESEGQPVASHINIVLDDTLLHWHVYSDRKFSHLKPNQYLLFRAAQIAASRGVKKLNLGATPPDADSLRAYKAKWGGKEYSYNTYEFRTLLGKVL